MARAFVISGPSYLSSTSTVLDLTFPQSACAWIRLTATPTTFNWALNFGNNSFAGRFSFGVQATGPPFFIAVRGSAAQAYSFGTNATVNQWYHLALVSSAANNHALYLDGNSTPILTSTTAVGTLTNNGLCIASLVSAGSSTFEGHIAEVAHYAQYALTTADIAALAKGYAPDQVSPQNLDFYTPLIRDEDRDIVSGIVLTANNSPTVAAHPRVFRRRRTRAVFAPAAAGGRIMGAIAGRGGLAGMGGIAGTGGGLAA